MASRHPHPSLLLSLRPPHLSRHTLPLVCLHHVLRQKEVLCPSLLGNLYSHTICELAHFSSGICINPYRRYDAGVAGKWGQTD